jgi:hypothetical protein
MKLFYIGDMFYSESGTMMSPIYHSIPLPPEGGYYRSDWGEVSLPLTGENNDINEKSTN